MVFAVIGGDKRQEYLKKSLVSDGHKVVTFALGKDEKNLEDTIKSAGAVILPLPAFRDGYLNAPKSEKKYEKEYILSVVSGKRTYGGMIEGDGIYDYYAQEELILHNALITAECTINAIQSEIEDTICGKSFLILGYGRIGEMLCGKISGLGGICTAAARRSVIRKKAACAGIRAVSFDGLDQIIEKFDIVINTVPQQVLGEKEISKAKPDCLLVEIASAPYGIDLEFAKKLGRKTLLLPGLPGKVMPKAAAEAIKETIYNLMEE